LPWRDRVALVAVLRPGRVLVFARFGIIEKCSIRPV